ncbi:glucose/sorbosone dehydrogenase [Solirubrobacter pauli]|uniref:Glucose/sorbosone dehydrogenase n=1 Tax=Solirubrobacter pauli TaxID=166793 RepID=A0A660KWJ4_9ACTN|nr:ThuA domain-containing protein [Solirubrobacter pauli]RKQ84815.1 glucose/sorbosone dehydrogenase [Solirubrobacter pauli]
MKRRGVGAALLSLALVAPATAQAQPKAAPADPYKVLVVTSTQDALATAGIDAITQAVGSAGTVTAPAPADVGAQFTPQGLDAYRTVVFLNTGQASPLNDAQRANFEAYFKKGGGFVGVGSAVETDSSWSFLTSALGTRSSGRTASQSGTVKVFDRVHDATKNLPEYWDRTESWYNFAKDVRGQSHVLATVVEDPFGPQPGGNTLDGIAGGTMGANHPVSFCKDFNGGRSFYTALGTAAGSFDAQLREHLKGAISWAAGQSDPTYSDCGATVLNNYQQVKVSGPPNLNEPIGFDQLPDGRIIQTARRGELRLHDPVKGTTQVIADFSSTSVPLTQRIYTNSEDGLYGPAVDPNFATNHWVYLYYAPQTVTDVKLSDGTVVTQTTPNTTPPASAPSKTAWDPYVGYFQLSRFKFIDGDGTNPPKLDLGSEQQILRVSNNRQACCHVAGDIDFDAHGNLWFVTGDDTEANGVNGGGFGPMNDQLTDEQQTVRNTNATGGTFTLSFKGQTTAPLPYNATTAQVDAALEALSTIGVDNVQTSGSTTSTTANTGNVNVYFRRALQQADQEQITINGAGLTGNSPTATAATVQQGGWFINPIGDTRRGAANTNDLRGKVNRIKVKDAIAAADQNKADFGSGGAYTIPAGNLFPLQSGQPQAKTRPEVYAMGFRNPYRIQVDENDVAYVTDYSPDSQVPQRGRGPAGAGRVEIVRKAANYGWPMCVTSKVSYYKWSYSEFAANYNPASPAIGVPLNDPPQKWDCDSATPHNDSKWVRDGGPANEPGLQILPPVTDADIWYSYRDNNASAPLGTPCAAYADPTPGPIAPGSTSECPRLFPELYTGGVGPHGAAKYHFDPANPNTAKFPPYYDNSIVLGEFTQDTLREIKTDSQNRIFKINGLLDCGQVSGVGGAASVFNFECDNPEDLQFGADGDLYLLTYGDGFFAINQDAGMYKWEYVKGQRSPKSVIKTNRTDGALPLTVQFDGSGSSDPDPGDSIRYEWDFGDGSAISEEASPSHVYAKAGRYTAVLTVTDSSGKKTASSTVITAGNTSPTITVEAPLDGGLFSFGDTIQYKVTVTDPEDPSIDCKDVTVTFVLGHDTHGHAENSATGCTGFLQTNRDDVDHGGNVFGVISATYADKGGSAGQAPSLETTSQVQIRQKHQEVEHVVTQSGTATAANTDNGAGVHRSSLTAGDWLQLNGAYNLQQINTVSFRVADAAAGRTAGSPLAAVEVRADAIDGPLVTTANLVSTGGTGTWTTQTFPISLSGRHNLFLVFRAVTGGATGNNLFNLNWAEFGGNGITVVQTNAAGDVGGSVPATLALSLGAPATFGAFTPGAEKTYTAKTDATVISTAGDATLSVSDPGHLTNGAFSLPQPLQVALSKSTWTGPTSNEKVDVLFTQKIGANDALRTGAYSKTLTFTLSTTQP